MKVIISRLVEISLKRKYLEVIKREDVSERIKEVLDDETLPMDLRLEIMEEMIDNPELGLLSTTFLVVRKENIRTML